MDIMDHALELQAGKAGGRSTSQPIWGPTRWRSRSTGQFSESGLDRPMEGWVRVDHGSKLHS
jgi:hypothetical protein